MNKLLNNVKKNYLIYLIIGLMLFGLTSIFIIDRYAPDTYFFENVGAKFNAVDPYLHNGRVLMSAFLWLVSVLNLSAKCIKLVSWIIGFISLWLACIIMFNLIRKYRKNTILNILVSVCTVFNPFVMEYFMFPEFTGIMCLGIFFTFLSVKFLINYFNDSRAFYIVSAILFAILSILCYQGGISLLVIMPLIWILERKDTVLGYLKKLILACIPFCIAALFTAILSKLLGISRLSTHFVLKDKLLLIKNGVINLLTTTFAILPNYLLVILFVLALLLCIIICRKNYKKAFVLLAICILATFISSCVPHIFSSYVWVVPRSTIGLGLLFIIPIIIGLIYSRDIVLVNNLFIIMLAIMFIFQITGNISLAKSQIINDNNALLEARQIANLVDVYESNEHKTIKEIRAYYDQATKYNYSGVKSVGDMNIRVYAIDWAFIDAYSIHTGRKYKKAPNNDEVKEYCGNNNWDYFSQEQLMFKDDKLFVCIY